MKKQKWVKFINYAILTLGVSVSLASYAQVDQSPDIAQSPDLAAAVKDGSGEVLGNPNACIVQAQDNPFNQRLMCSGAGCKTVKGGEMGSTWSLTCVFKDISAAGVQIPPDGLTAVKNCWTKYGATRDGKTTTVLSPDGTTATLTLECSGQVQRTPKR
jgi:hypothetical protein